MREDNSYWVRRLNSSRLSRRRFVGGAATAGVGAAGLAVVGCGDDDDGEPGTSGDAPAATVAPTVASGPQKGGIFRSTSANNTWDTFDSDRSRFTPMAVVFAMSYHGVVQWESFAAGKIAGYFAESFEQPDTKTYTFKVRNGLTWHNKPPVNGRAANATDIVKFIERNKAGKTLDGKDDANFYRKALFQIVDKAEAVDAKTARVTLTKPNPFFLNLLAESYTKVQAPEAIEKFEADYSKFNADHIIGTADYTMTSFDAAGAVSWRRFDKASRVPFADGRDYVALFTDPAALQVAFEQKQVDAFAVRTQVVLDDLLKRFEGKVRKVSIFSANPMAGTYYGGAAPWNNPNLVGAFFRTIDRRALIQQMFQGNGVLSGNVPPTQDPFGIQEKELIEFPGYLADRAKDLAEAKRMWDAAGGSALGKITIDIPDIWEGAYQGVSAIITKQLKDNLGNEFEAKLEPYTTISSKIIQQKYGNGSNNIWYGWISEITEIEPSNGLFNVYNSANPGFQQYGVKLPLVDDLTNKLVTEFDQAKRIELAKSVERELIKNWGAGIPYNMVNINNILYWNYLHSGEPVPFVTDHNFGRDVYFDQKDPTWQGRPA